MLIKIKQRIKKFFIFVKIFKSINMKATVIRKEGKEVREINFSKVSIARGFIKDCAILTKYGVSYTLIKGK